MRPLYLILIILYLLSPIDLLPDFLGPIGRLDDIGLVLFALYQLSVRGKRSGRSHEQSNSASSEETTAAEEKKEKAPHEILEIDADASPEEIERAYKEMARKYHPDRVNHLGEDLQKMAHEKMVAITNAYEKMRPSRK